MAFFVGFIGSFNQAHRRQVDQNLKRLEISTAPIVSRIIMAEFMRDYYDAEDPIDAFLVHGTTEGVQSHEMETQKELHTHLNDHPHPPSPILPNFQQFIEEIPSSPRVICDQSLFSGHLDESNQLFPNNKATAPTEPLKCQKAAETERQRREKNSNAIKKIGRIILDNLREYNCGRTNSSVLAMLKLLSRDSKVGRTEVNKRDKFNTYHLRVLLGGRDPEITKKNLRTTRRILCRYLRRNVFFSKQITIANKSLYLNTMKCSALRCLHQSLAVRLQMSQ